MGGADPVGQRFRRQGRAPVRPTAVFISIAAKITAEDVAGQRLAVPAGYNISENKAFAVPHAIPPFGTRPVDRDGKAGGRAVF